MNPDEVRELYDSEYAETYDESFLLGDYFIECTEYEVSVLQRLISQSGKWLDVGCGTGYFLSRFPETKRAGLDISQAMLAKAIIANPSAQLAEGDFRFPKPEWNAKWDLVSCMWYAYCYCTSVFEVETTLSNLSDWTAAGGTLFLPVCDPNILCKVDIPYKPPPDSADGELKIPAVVWDWTDLPSGRRHRGMIAPHIEHLVSLLGQRFANVEVMNYPTFGLDALAARKAIIAKNRRG